MIRLVQGGKALGGFLSGFAGSLLGGFAKGLQNVGTITKTIIVAIAGGTASVLGGGKFANGAMSAAFIFMFNEMHKVYLKASELSVKQAYKLSELRDKIMAKMSDKDIIKMLGLPKYTDSLVVFNARLDIHRQLTNYLLLKSLDTAAGSLVPQHALVTVYQLSTTYGTGGTNLAIDFVQGATTIKGIYVP